jgi:hypothetical protein
MCINSIRSFLNIFNDKGVFVMKFKSQMKSNRFTSCILGSFAALFIQCTLVSCGQKTRHADDEVQNPQNNDDADFDRLSNRGQNTAFSTVGNGGNAIVCKENHRHSIQMLDLFEMSAIRHMTLTDFPDESTYDHVIDGVLTRLAKIDGELSKYYRDRVADFKQHATFLDHIKLSTISDNGSKTVIPENCQLIQLAVQQAPKFDGDLVYVIDNEVWNILDARSKAALILHEVIYRDALSRGHDNSYLTRYFNGLIFSKDFDDMNSQTYVKLIRSTNLPGGRFTYGGLKFWLSDVISKDDKGTIRSIQSDATELDGMGSHANLTTEGVNKNTLVEFYPDGTLKSASFKKLSFHRPDCQMDFKQDGAFRTTFRTDGTISEVDHIVGDICWINSKKESVSKLTHYIENKTIEFYPTMIPKKMNVNTGGGPSMGGFYDGHNKCTSVLEASDLDWSQPKIFVEGVVEFYENGTLKSGLSSQYMKRYGNYCKTRTGEVRHIVESVMMNFDEEGYIL